MKTDWIVRCLERAGTLDGATALTPVCACACPPASALVAPAHRYALIPLRLPETLDAAA